MADSVKVVLDYPVQLAGRKLTEVVMRRMTVGDLLDYPVKGAEDFEGEVRLLAHLIGLTPDDVRALDVNDYSKLQDVMVRFRTGKKR